MRGSASLAPALLAAIAGLIATGALPAGEVVDGAPVGGDAATRLVSRLLGETPLAEDLRHLCDRIGGRPTGSEACRRAIEWSAAAFRSAGLDRVSLEAFTIPELWLPGTAEASVEAPERFDLRIAVSPQSASTPGGRSIEGPLVDAGAGDPAGFAAIRDPEGSIALVSTAEMRSLADLFDEYMRDNAMIEAAVGARVGAILLMSTRPRGLLYRHPVRIDGTVAPIPVAVVSREQATRLNRLREHDEVRVRLAIANRIGGSHESHNVIAEIRGREAPGEIVLLGAHLDSWDLGTGAQDNAVNVATVLDVARAFADLGSAPRRTVRFVLFTGEEQGLHGSAGYVARHAGEMDDHVAAVILDTGSGRIKGFYLNGRPDLAAPVDRALTAVAGFGPFAHPADAIDGTDNFDFLLAGVPNLVADQEVSSYLPDYHAESDVFDTVDLARARQNAAVTAALVWSLADAPGRPAPRQSRAEVARLIEATGLEAQMKAFRQWDGWAAGRRGASAGPRDRENR